jgi:hypothetical protein
VDLLVVVSILPENVPQEHSLRMKAVLISWSSSPVHQCGKYRLLAGWVVVGSNVKLEESMCRFTVLSMAQRTVGSPVNIYVKEWEVALSFGSVVN